MERDFDTRPYNTDERRVCAYLQEVIPEIGWGDDPIGFIIVSHRHLLEMRRQAQIQGLNYGFHPQVHEQESP